MYLRIGLAHTSHMCLESPSHHVMYGYEIDFWDRHYFIKYEFFWRRYHSMFYLIIRRNANIFWPRLSSKTKKSRFSRKWGKTWKFETKILMEKIFFLHLVQKSACLVALLSSKLVFAMRPIYRIWDTMNFALEIRFSVFFCTKMVENGIFFIKIGFFGQNMSPVPRKWRLNFSQTIPDITIGLFPVFTQNIHNHK